MNKSNTFLLNIKKQILLAHCRFLHVHAALAPKYCPANFSQKWVNSTKKLPYSDSVWAKMFEMGVSAKKGEMKC